MVGFDINSAANDGNYNDRRYDGRNYNENDRNRDSSGRFTENNYNPYAPMGMTTMRSISAHMQTMDDKLKNAEENARNAYSLKQINPQQARDFYTVANDEMKHATMFHNMLNEETEKSRTQDEYAKLMWDKINEDYTNMMTKVKMLLQMYEGR